MNEADASNHMEQALAQENGLRISTSNPEAYRQLCYRVREDLRAQGDLRFDPLKFYISPNGEEIWIVVKHVETEETNQASPHSAL